MRVSSHRMFRPQTIIGWLRAALLLVILAAGASAQSSALHAQVQTSSMASGRQRSGSDRGRSLTGRVVEEGGRPIADASVYATPAGVASLSSAIATVKIRTALTDETGRFVLEDLAPGAYALSAFVPGFVSAPGSGGQAYYRPGDSATLQLVKGAVITGTVTAASGEPLTGIRVRAVLVKDANGGPPRTRSLSTREFIENWKTDDRGVYRIFGLEPGSYIVSAGGPGLMNFSEMSVEGYDDDAPTFYPSATRDGALEVKVRGGDESGGIDIRYREARGHSISGAVSGKVTLTSYSALVVTLTHAATGNACGFSIALFSDDQRSFEFDGIADGEYDVVATVGYQTDDMMISRPQRAVVKGSDVTGLDLALGPVGSIAGRLVLEKAVGADPAACPPTSKGLMGETVIVARRDGKGKEPPKVPTAIAASPFSQTLDGVPDEKGEFKVRPLDVGRYRLIADLPGEGTFVRAVSKGASTQAGKPVDLARNGIDLKSGERLAGITVTITEGAAGLGGRVVPAKQGASLPLNLRVHLVPAEKETDDEVLRFFEAPIDRDGTFSFKHVGPGRYFLLAKEEPEEATNAADYQPVAWRGSSRRAKLRHEAEAFNVPVQLSQCQRVTGQVLRYSPPPPSTPPPQ